MVNFESKIKHFIALSELSFQKGLDTSREEPGRPVVRGRRTSLQGQIKLLEERLNTPETRSTPPRHIEVIRKLADSYLKLGEEDISYYVKAENLYKQFNVLYPLHMEKIDWLVWIETSAKAKLIREARRLPSLGYLWCDLGKASQRSEIRRRPRGNRPRTRRQG